MMDKDMMKYVENDQFAAYVGLKLIRVEPGYAEAQLELKEHHLNGVGIVQGGALFTLADYAFAAASNAKGVVTVGLNASISYYKTAKGKVITAKASELHSGRTVSGYNVDIFDEDGTLLARFNGNGFKKSK